MVFQLNFKGPHHDIRMRLENALQGCYLGSIFLHSGHFSAQKRATFLSYFGLKNPLSTFFKRDFSALKLLRLKRMF